MAKGNKIQKKQPQTFWQTKCSYNVKKTVIIIDSCFWHGCKKHCRIPETNHSYWVNEINRNRSRDKKVSKYYKENKWKIIRIWEHQLENQKQINKIFQDLK